MKNTLIFIWVLFIFFPLDAQNGYPYIKNFTPDDYLAPGQIWDVDQSSDGVMWFAGNSGICFFDGAQWRKYDFNTENGFAVRSLEIVNDTLFIGGIGEFGYVVFEDNEFKYKALSQQLDSSMRLSFLNIWSVAAAGKYVLFQGDTIIFMYDRAKNTLMPLIQGQRFLFLNKINDKIYFSSAKEIFVFDAKKNKLQRLDNDGVIKLHFLPYNDSLLMTIEKNKIKFLNIISGNLLVDTRFDSINSLLKSNFIYAASFLHDKDLYALGTVKDGIYLVKGNGEIYQHIDKKEGLVAHTVLKLFVDRQNNLWAATNNGISVLNISLPYTILDYRTGLDGTPYDIIDVRDELYAATHLNLYYYSKSRKEFVPIYMDDGQPIVQAFSLDTVRFSDGDLKLIAATARGLVLVSKSGSKYLSRGATYSFVRVEDTLFFVTNYFLEKIVYRNGTFAKPQQVISLPTFFYLINQSQYSRLWFFTDKNRLVAYYDVVTGEYKSFISPVKINNAMWVDSIYVFTTERGLYEYDELGDSIVSSHFFINDFLRDKNITGLVKSSDEEYVAYSYNNSFSKLYFLKVKNNKIVKIDSSISDIVKIFHKVKFCYHNLWLLTFDKFIRYHFEDGKSYFYAFKPLITGIYTEGGKEIYKYPQVWRPSSFSLPYRDKNLIINFSLPNYFAHSNVEYSYKLVHNGREDVLWSKWSDHTMVHLLLLREGRYTFYLRSRNGVIGQLETVSFSFRIRPPFYRSPGAIIVYFLLVLLAIYAFLKIRDKTLLQQRDELIALLEKRTQQIQKTQEELAVQEESMVRVSQLLKDKNAQINKLIGELNLANENIMDLNKYISETIEQAKIIQRAMFLDRKILANYFKDFFVYSMPKDLLSGDFYWVYRLENKLFIAVVDCVGQGFSGVLMNSLVYSILNTQICKGNSNVDTILTGLSNELDKILSNISEKENAIIFNVDIGIASINVDTKKLQFAAIRNSALLITKEGEVIELYPNKNGEISDGKDIFIDNRVIDQGDRLYLFTDGFYNQIGGDKKQKYGRKNFYSLLQKIHSLPMKEQYNILKKEFEMWREDNNQVDDVLILGMKIDLDMLS